MTKLSQASLETNLKKILQLFKDKKLQFHIVDNIILTTIPAISGMRGGPYIVD